MIMPDGEKKNLRFLTGDLGKSFQKSSVFCMRALTLFYLAVVVLALPFYYDRKTGYGTIGTTKSVFFRTWGFRLAPYMTVLFLIYLLAALVCKMREKKGQKGVWVSLPRKIRSSLTLTDRFAIGYALVLCASYCLTDYRETALLGAPGWYMGLLPNLVLLGSYFAISRLLTKRLCKGLLCALLAASFVVFLLGILNRYRINPLHFEYAGRTYISTIGNINWYCGYWAVLFPVGCGMFLFCDGGWDKKQPRGILKKGLLALWCAVGFATGVTQGSVSGMFALTVMTLAMGCVALRGQDGRVRFGQFLELLLLFSVTVLLVAGAERLFPGRNDYSSELLYRIITKTPFFLIAGVAVMWCYMWYQTLQTLHGEKTVRIVRKIWRGIVVTAVAALALYAVLVVCNTRWPGSIGSLSEKEAFFFDGKWGSQRGGTWSAGMRVWLAQDPLHKLVGVGPDAMADFIYSGQDGKLLAAVSEQFYGYRLTNAHGEWITLLADTGVLGLLCFAGMMLSSMIRLLRQRGSGFAGIVCIACGFAVLSYTANNVFSFEQTVNMTQIFVVMGLGEYMMRKNKLSEQMF